MPTLVKNSDAKGVRRFILDDPWNERRDGDAPAMAGDAFVAIATSRFFFDERGNYIVIRAFTLLLLLICCGNATELLRDKHTDTTYIFKSESKDGAPRISQREAVLKADEWASGFYGDDLLRFVDCQFKTKPIRHWLITFQKAETGQEFYAVILPDGGVVIPSVERGL
ncbi:MAG: hypothetical protein JO334_03685 [Verrucomicrobia bacterium]|nr:hypothetical protein [Verrucomicrobiota bacterium]